MPIGRGLRAREMVSPTPPTPFPFPSRPGGAGVSFGPFRRRQINFLKTYADVWNIVHGDGAVITLSRNMGRWVWFHTLLEQKLGEKRLKLVDSFPPASTFAGYPPNAGRW